MPMYEYRCRNCGSTFDELVTSSQADSDISCPECGKYEAEKLMSAFASSGGSTSSSVSSAGSSCGSGGFT